MIEAFELERYTGVVALVGAGGKTSLMYALARELHARGEAVITTTTTKIRPPDPDQSPCLLLTDQDPGLHELRALLKHRGHVTLAGSVISTGKVRGVSEEIVEACRAYADWVICEADGASGRPVKAPEQWEPVIPASTRLVIPVIGLDCLGRRATEDVVFRMERFSEVTGSRIGDKITPLVIAALLCHPRGALKGVPESADVVAFLNKVDLLDVPGPIVDTVRCLVKNRCERIRRIVVGKLKGGVEVSAFSVHDSP